MKKLIYGVGINDTNLRISTKVDGKWVICRLYGRWHNMLGRCYSPAESSRSPSYAECKVCDEWLLFSNFRRWMEKQDWQGKHLDKDILVVGNKTYSPDTCVFVDALTNTFIEDRLARRGKLPIGVTFYKSGNNFKSQCGNPFTKKNEHLGYFNCPNEAYLAWKKRKHELACQLADLQTDERVANALRIRYA